MPSKLASLITIYGEWGTIWLFKIRSLHGQGKFVSAYPPSLYCCRCASMASSSAINRSNRGSLATAVSAALATPV